MSVEAATGSELAAAQGKYAIAGGADGKRRLNLLAEIMRPTTLGLLAEADVREGKTCLDVGCGGGHVTLDLARIVGPSGRAVGIDFDPTIIALAQEDQLSAGITNAEFAVGDVHALVGLFDVAYARFLLSHLPEPERVIGLMSSVLAPGGMLVVEDIDCSGCFCEPRNPAYDRFLHLYAEAVSRGGGDANLGRRLPALLRSLPLSDVRWHVFQPVHADGPHKQIMRITMDKIRPAVLKHQLATDEEIDRILAEMGAFAADPTSLVAMPRMVQAWGRRH